MGLFSFRQQAFLDDKVEERFEVLRFELVTVACRNRVRLEVDQSSVGEHCKSRRPRAKEPAVPLLQIASFLKLREHVVEHAVGVELVSQEALLSESLVAHNHFLSLEFFGNLHRIRKHVVVRDAIVVDVGCGFTQPRESFKCLFVSVVLRFLLVFMSGQLFVYLALDLFFKGKLLAIIALTHLCFELFTLFFVVLKVGNFGLEVTNLSLHLCLFDGPFQLLFLQQ